MTNEIDEQGPTARRLDLSFRETMIVLASLHHWQEDLQVPERLYPLYYFFDDVEPYSASEIEDICERINQAWLAPGGSSSATRD